ncbi:hypothetical protein [Flavobacterium fontis]|nr:hypothetical protein [Flavobacterium fontis]
MKNGMLLNVNGYLGLILIFLIVVSCKKDTSISCSYLDIIGDQKWDTITLESNINKQCMQDIFFLKNGKKERILSILPRVDCAYVLTKPKIEMIYFEANEIQSKDKGLRVMIRNTDLVPDYFFIDLFYEKEWIIKKYGVMNTNPMDSLFVKSKNINKSLTSELGNERICNPKTLYSIHLKK